MTIKVSTEKPMSLNRLYAPPKKSTKSTRTLADKILTRSKYAHYSLIMLVSFIKLNNLQINSSNTVFKQDINVESVEPITPLSSGDSEVKLNTAKVLNLSRRYKESFKGQLGYTNPNKYVITYTC